MLHLSIIKAVYCPLSEQLHSVALCEQLCDHYYNGCTESRLKHPCVMCPVINRLMPIGSCADECEWYEGDEVEYMRCSYEVRG